MWRVLLRLRKGEQVKYLSHLDMTRAFEFALRRSGLPVAYSEGFNPRPRMSFGGAIGVGVLSEDERVQLELSRPVPPETVQERLNEQLPPGMEALSAEAVPENVKSPISALSASQFRLALSGCAPQEIEDAVRSLFAASEVRVRRVRKEGVKEVDVRPYLLSLDAARREDDLEIVEISLTTGSSGGARPQDVAEALRNRLPSLIVKEMKRLKQY